VSVTVTAVNASAAGWLEAGPDGSFTQGAASVVNYDTGENVANSAILKLPANGKIVVYSSQAVDVIIDVTGYVTAPTATYSYAYDGDGLRRTKTWYGITATYRYSLAEALSMPIEENVFGGLLRTSYLYGPNGLPIEQITELAGSVTSQVWFHHDQLGSTRLLTDQTGDPRTTYSFDPYGNTATTDTNPAQPTVTTPLQYAGQFTDTETGYQYLRNRYYDPTTGQFLSRDPINVATRSAYGYAGNSPLNFSDPAGLAPWDWVADHVVDPIVPDHLGVDTSCVTDPGSCDLPIPDAVERALGSDIAHDIRIGAGAVLVASVATACIAATAGGCVGALAEASPSLMGSSALTALMAGSSSAAAVGVGSAGVSTCLNEAEGPFGVWDLSPWNGRFNPDELDPDPWRWWRLWW
jgi:RHS repeat-associated protein